MNQGVYGAFVEILLNPWFRWISLLLLTFLTVYGYVQEPIRFSDKQAWFGLSFRYQYFVIQMINMLIAIIAFLGLWYTVPFTDKLPYLWYVPIMVLSLAYITQLSVDSGKITDDKKSLHPPPSNMLPKRTRLLIFWGILVLDIITFFQGYIYAGVSEQFKTTVLHQFILNRFGGVSDPSNVLSFSYSWIGIFAIVLDIYMLYNQMSFRACDYNLPAAWNF